MGDGKSKFRVCRVFRGLSRRSPAKTDPRPSILLAALRENKFHKFCEFCQKISAFAFYAIFCG